MMRVSVRGVSVLLTTALLLLILASVAVVAEPQPAVIGVWPTYHESPDGSTTTCDLALGAYATATGAFQVLAASFYRLQFATGQPPFWFSAYDPATDLYLFLTQLYVPAEPKVLPVAGAALVAFNLTSQQVLYTVEYPIPTADCPLQHSFCWFIPVSVTFLPAAGQLLVNMNLVGQFGAATLRIAGASNAAQSGVFAIDPLTGALSYLSPQPKTLGGFTTLIADPAAPDADAGVVFLQAEYPEGVTPAPNCSDFYYWQWEPSVSAAAAPLPCVHNQANFSLVALPMGVTAALFNTSQIVAWTLANRYSLQSLVSIDPQRGSVTESWWNLAVSGSECPLPDVALSATAIFSFSPNACSQPDQLFQIERDTGVRRVLGTGRRLQALQYVLLPSD
jgi:hypothetical protein